VVQVVLPVQAGQVDHLVKTEILGVKLLSLYLEEKAETLLIRNLL
jgi:hypothetical protein